jgi:HSP20 family protein
MKKFSLLLFVANLNLFGGSFEKDLAIVESYFNSFATSLLNSESLENTYITNYPAVNIYERPDSYLIEVEVSGLQKNEIEVSLLQDKIVKISGERKTRDDKLVSNEGFFGKFEKSFSLPSDADTSTIAVEHENGILIISINRDKSLKKRVLTIQ